MYSKYYKKGISENIQDNKYIVVVAHHDDEILWASSICEKASKVIICFSEDEDSKKTSIGRKNFSRNAPENFYYLNIKEPTQKGSSFILNKSQQNQDKYLCARRPSAGRSRCRVVDAGLHAM